MNSIGKEKKYPEEVRLKGGQAVASAAGALAKGPLVRAEETKRCRWPGEKLGKGPKGLEKKPLRGRRKRAPALHKS